MLKLMIFDDFCRVGLGTTQHNTSVYDCVVFGVVFRDLEKTKIVLFLQVAQSIVFLNGVWCQHIIFLTKN